MTEDQYVTIEGHTIRYVQVHPDEKTDDIPVVFIGAFSQWYASYHSEIMDLVAHGRAVGFVTPLRG